MLAIDQSIQDVVIVSKTIRGIYSALVYDLLFFTLIYIYKSHNSHISHNEKEDSQ